LLSRPQVPQADSVVVVSDSQGQLIGRQGNGSGALDQGQQRPAIELARLPARIEAESAEASIRLSGEKPRREMPVFGTVNWATGWPVPSWRSWIEAFQ
jgi:hypothetical protein